jgi:hypothetical protein
VVNVENGPNLRTSLTSAHSSSKRQVSKAHDIRTNDDERSFGQRRGECGGEVGEQERGDLVSTNDVGS